MRRKWFYLVELYSDTGRGILDMWQQADKNQMILRPLKGSGWKITDQASLEMDWDSEEHVETVRHRVALLTKGCNCKTGCHIACCECVKRNGECGAGSSCQNCCNLLTPTTSDDLVDLAIAEKTSTIHDEEVDDIMLALFGELDDSSDQSDDEPMDNAAVNETHGSDFSRSDQYLHMPTSCGSLFCFVLNTQHL